MGIAGLASYLLMVSPAIRFVFKPVKRFPEYPQWMTIIVTYILYGLFSSGRSTSEIRTPSFSC